MGSTIHEMENPRKRFATLSAVEFNGTPSEQPEQRGI